MRDLLERSDIPLVKNAKVRRLCVEAWRRGESVPRGVIHIGSQLRPLSDAEVQFGKRLWRQRLRLKPTAATDPIPGA